MPFDKRSTSRLMLAFALVVASLAVGIFSAFRRPVRRQQKRPASRGGRKIHVTTAVHAPKRKLVYVLHAYRSSSAKVEPLRQEIQAIWPDALVVAPDLPMWLFSRKDPSVIAGRLAREIDQRFDPEEFGSVVLVGHSVGALIARKAYLIACGERGRAPFEERLRRELGAGKGLFPGFQWHNAVERIVLLAAMNRGWRVSHHISLWRAPIWAAGTLVGQLIHLLTPWWRRLLTLTVRRGAEFITNLRVQWIVLRNEQRRKAIAGPLTIQLLGSTDDMVAPDDNIDLVSGNGFIYLDVPESTHTNIVQVQGEGAPAGRLKVIRRALTQSEATLRADAVLPSDDQVSEPDLEITKVAFVIHGIRDAGYWTHKIARRVRKLGEQGGSKRWATETSSYGYFPMAPFLSPFGRRSKVEWMMDQYAEALARYPRARFHYVGHSNGTYLLAKALKLYPACRFERVVFAGSVVRRRYDWSAAIERKQVASVLNLVGTSDWVVAFFPRLFEIIRGIQDLGGAGHLGFKFGPPRDDLQNRVVEGGHDAGIREQMWNHIANYLLNGVIPPEPTTPHRSWLIWLLGWVPFFVWAVILVLLYLGWLGIRWLIPDGFAEHFAEGFALAAYLAGIIFVLKRL